MDTMRKARIAYTGPALLDGEMDIRELAPALLAFGDLVEAIHQAIGIKQEVRISLNADSIRRGSFDLTMFLHPKTVLEQAKILAGMADESGLAALMDILGWAKDAGKGIFSLLKFLGGRSPSKVEPTTDGSMMLILPNGEKFVTSADVLKVYKDAKCREYIEAVVHPVERDGIDGFEIRDPDVPDNNKPIERVEKSDVPAFLAPHVEDATIETQEQEMFARLIAPNFADGKWKFDSGEHPFFADILDKSFLKKVESGEMFFRRGDMLRVRFYIHQTLHNGKLSNTYIITKVLGLQHPPEQMNLF